MFPWDSEANSTMKNHLNTLLILLSVITTSCIEKRNKAFVESITLSPDTTISVLNDSSFIPPNMKCLDMENDAIYYSDYANGIVILDTCYQVKAQIGSRGQGPGEFLGAAHFYIDNQDSMYVLDEGKRAMELFVKGEYKRTIPFPENLRLSFNTRFWVDQQNICHSVIAKEAPLVVFGKDTPKFLGSYIIHDNPELGRHTTKHVLKGEDNTFFVIGCVYPTLQQYSLDGSLLQEFDLSLIPEINKMIKAYKNAPQSKDSYFTVIQDVYFYKKHLYMLVATTDDSRYNCKVIAVIDTSDNALQHTATYHLSGDVYDTFCVGNGRLYAHNLKKSCLDIYRLSLILPTFASL